MAAPLKDATIVRALAEAPLVALQVALAERGNHPEALEIEYWSHGQLLSRSVIDPSVRNEMHFPIEQVAVVVAPILVG